MMVPPLLDAVEYPPLPNTDPRFPFRSAEWGGPIQGFRRIYTLTFGFDLVFPEWFNGLWPLPYAPKSTYAGPLPPEGPPTFH